MKVLVTGASGYIASHLIPKLIQRGHEVISTSRTRPKIIRGTWIKHNINDNTDTNLFELFECPDICIHLAWSGIPNYNEFSQLENFFPHYNFLRNLQRNGLKDFTVTGTCLEYGKYEGEAIETTKGVDLTYYAQAKIRLLNILQLLPINLKWCRLFYNYGPGSIFYSTILNCKGSYNIVDESQYRDYMSIEMTVNHIINCATQKEVTGIINVCTGLPIQVVQLAKVINPNAKLNIGNYEKKSYEGNAFWGNRNKLNSVPKRNL